MDLLTSISVSIIVAAVLAFAARWLRQPLLLGYVLAGAVLGPHVGLHVVTDEASIELIAEIGLILLLYLIGLEISLPRLLQAGRGIQWDAGLEHRGVVRRLVAGEGEIGSTRRLERDIGIGLAVVPGLLQRIAKQLEAALGDVRHQGVAVAEMAVRRRGADPRRARGIGEGEAGRPLLADQVKRGPDQRLAQIAVVVALAALGPVVLRPSHVNGSYMS